MSLRAQIASRKDESKKKDEEQMTFSPSLTPHRGREKDVKLILGSRFDHLYTDAIKRKSAEAIAKAAAEEKNDVDNTFKPIISLKARSNSRDRSSSTDRLHNASGAGRLVVKELPIDTHLFKPLISKRASSLTRSSSVETTTRLYESRVKNQELKKREKEEADKMNSDLCTFSPKLYRSRSASWENITNKDLTTVVDRLLKSGEDTKQKIEEEKLRRKNNELKDMTFQPQVNKHIMNSKGDAEVYIYLYTYMYIYVSMYIYVYIYVYIYIYIYVSLYIYVYIYIYIYIYIYVYIFIYIYICIYINIQS
jgi:hypothetical protein